MEQYVSHCPVRELDEHQFGHRNFPRDNSHVIGRSKHEWHQNAYPYTPPAIRRHLEDIHPRLRDTSSVSHDTKLFSSFQLLPSATNSISKMESKLLKRVPGCRPVLPQEQQMDRPGFGLKSVPPQIFGFTSTKSSMSARRHFPDIP